MALLVLSDRDDELADGAHRRQKRCDCSRYGCPLCAPSGIELFLCDGRCVIHLAFRELLLELLTSSLMLGLPLAPGLLLLICVFAIPTDNLSLGTRNYAFILAPVRNRPLKIGAGPFSNIGGDVRKLVSRHISTLEVEGICLWSAA
jgi:hypothetical protein